MLQILVLLALLEISNAFMPGSRLLMRQSRISMATIIDTVASSGSFNTLVAAVEATGLTGALSGSEPFTLFAPTDEAFAKLPEGVLDELFSDIPRLTNFLLYHLIEGNVRPNRNGKTFTTLNGNDLSVEVTVDTTDSYIRSTFGNPALVIDHDLEADNGLVHVIDELLLDEYLGEFLPATSEEYQEATGEESSVEYWNESQEEYYGQGAAASSFTTIVAAIQAAGLADTLSGPGQFTVFAPTDDAFAKLPEGTNIDEEILKYHIVEGTVRPNRNGKTFVTLHGEEIAVEVAVDTADSYIHSGGGFRAKVVAHDIQAGNGLIHVIDEVLLPYDKAVEY